MEIIKQADYKTEKIITEGNCEKAEKALPSRLLRKEENLFHRLKKSKKSSENKLNELYQFMDEIYFYVNKNSPCKKGCSHCCHYNVSISDLEAHYIQKTTKSKISNQRVGEPNFHGESCPFLIDNSCSIYESRPFVCRQHHSMSSTSEWCNVDIANTYEFAKVQFSEIKRSYDMILKESNLMTRFDIRQKFESKFKSKGI